MRETSLQPDAGGLPFFDSNSSLVTLRPDMSFCSSSKQVYRFGRLGSGATMIPRSGGAWTDALPPMEIREVLTSDAMSDIAMLAARLALTMRPSSILFKMDFGAETCESAFETRSIRSCGSFCLTEETCRTSGLWAVADWCKLLSAVDGTHRDQVRANGRSSVPQLERVFEDFLLHCICLNSQLFEGGLIRQCRVEDSQVVHLLGHCLSSNDHLLQLHFQFISSPLYLSCHTM